MFKKAQKWLILVWLACFAASLAAQESAAAKNAIVNPQALANFFEALGQARAGRRKEPVRVSHFGDSHVAADILTAFIRNSLQADFGDGGPGYLVPGNPFSTKRRGVTSSLSAGWVFDGIARKGGANDGFYGLAGFSLSANRANETITLNAPATRFTIYYLQRPGGGRLEIRANGVAAPEPVPTAANAPASGFYAIDFPAAGAQTLEIRSLDNAPVRILGVVAENHAAPGLVYDPHGINGARLKRWQTWNAQIINENLRQRAPNLVILAYGTNEVADPDWTPEGYARLLAGIVRQIRQAAPDAAVLIYAPAERADNLMSLSRMPALVEAQRRAATESGAAFWDGYAAMGPMSALVANKLAQPDRVHLSGKGYQIMGAIFASELRAAAVAYLKVQRPPAKKTPKIR